MVLGFTSTLDPQTAMVRPILLTSIAPIVFLLSGVPVQGGVALQSRKITIFLNLTTWLWAAFSVAVIAIIFHVVLLIFSIKAFFMHLNKHPSYLFSKEPVGDARTGLVFCTLVVLSVLLSTAYFPLLMAFVIVPTQNDDTSIPFFAPTLTYMVINLSEALCVGALLTLVNHRRYLHFGKEEKMLWKKILDFTIVAFMIIFLIIWTVVYCLPSIFNNDISGFLFGIPFGPDSHTVEILNLGAAASHVETGFYALAIIDIFVSAEFLRRKLREARIHDQVRKC